MSVMLELWSNKHSPIGLDRQDVVFHAILSQSLQNLAGIGVQVQAVQVDLVKSGNSIDLKKDSVTSGA